MLHNTKVVVALAVFVISLLGITFFLSQEASGLGIRIVNNNPKIEASIVNKVDLQKLLVEREIDKSIFYKDTYQVPTSVEINITPQRQQKLGILVKFEEDKPDEIVTEGSFTLQNGKLIYYLYLNADLSHEINYDSYAHKQLIDLIVLSTQNKNQEIGSGSTTSPSDLNAEDIAFRYEKPFLSIRKK